MIVRKFRIGDEHALRQVFYSSIHINARVEYTLEQRNAWAPSDYDFEDWSKRLQKLQPFVVELDGQPIGYADLQPDGLLDHFFVAAGHARQGVGRLLMQTLHQEASNRAIRILHAHVSTTAQPFFERFGFGIIKHQTVLVRGVELSNALMEKRLMAPFLDAS